MVLEILAGLIFICLLILLFRKENPPSEGPEINPKLDMLEFENFHLGNQVESLKNEIERLEKQLPEFNNLVDKDSYVAAKKACEQWESAYNELKTTHDKYMSEKKSKEVRLGAIAETLTPFLEGFPYNPKKLRALGSPIDYVAFEDDEIVFIEVKSGNSQLGSNQRNIRNLVEDGKVRFEVHRIDEDGLSVL